jgi:hypothetical protein
LPAETAVSLAVLEKYRRRDKINLDTGMKFFSPALAEEKTNAFQ